MVKLLDWRERLSELEASANPFAVVVRAHLLSQATRRDRAGRLAPKLALLRELHRRGYSREQITDLFQFIDWVVRLPEPEDVQFWREVQTDEEARRMPYVTSIERIGRRVGRAEGRVEGRAEGRVEGRVEGLREGLAVALRRAFGDDGAAVAAALAEVERVAVLERVAAALDAGASLAELRRIINRSARSRRSVAQDAAPSQ